MSYTLKLHHYFNVVNSASRHNWNRVSRNNFTINFHGFNAFHHTVLIIYFNLIGRSTEFSANFVSFPIRWNAGIHYQPIVRCADAEDVLRDSVEIP